MIRATLTAVARAFKRPLETAPASPPAAGQAEDLAALRALARQLQARAASGSAGCVAARRELRDVRHRILRCELAA